MTDVEMQELAVEWDREAEAENLALEAEREAEYYADERAEEAFMAQVEACDHDMATAPHMEYSFCQLCGMVG